MTWKDKSCEKCVFRDDDMCKRFPPTVPGIDINSTSAWYPEIQFDGGEFQDACAEYAESLDRPVDGTP
jgi:hypothetical protein